MAKNAPIVRLPEAECKRGWRKDSSCGRQGFGPVDDPHQTTRQQSAGDGVEAAGQGARKQRHADPQGDRHPEQGQLVDKPGLQALMDANGKNSIAIHRFNKDAGRRTEENSRITDQFNLSLTGQFNDDWSLLVGASIGIAIFPTDGTSAEALVRCADKAMYRAKRDRCGYAFSQESASAAPTPNGPGAAQ